VARGFGPGETSSDVGSRSGQIFGLELTLGVREHGLLPTRLSEKIHGRDPARLKISLLQKVNSHDK
jgi:hypothetical protein